jgi:hypothetical protein
MVIGNGRRQARLWRTIILEFQSWNQLKKDEKASVKWSADPESIEYSARRSFEICSAVTYKGHTEEVDDLVFLYFIRIHWKDHQHWRKKKDLVTEWTSVLICLVSN